MTRTCSVLALLIGLAGPAVAAAPDVSPDPKSLVVPDDVLSKARELVRQLGSEQFAEREEAELALAKLGRAARAALLDAAGTDPNAEVRTRCQTLLPKATALEMKARIEVFLADVEGKYEHDLPGWNELCVFVRNEWSLFGHPVWSDQSLDKAARGVFAELISTQANRHVMMAVGGHGDLAALASARRQELYSQYSSRAVVVGGMVTYPNRKQPTVADMAALLFAEAQAGGKSVAPRTASISTLISVSGFTNAVQASNESARVYRAIAAGWIDTRTDPMDVYYATSIARNLGMNDAALRVAVRLFETKGAVGSYRGLVTATIAQLGTKAHVPMLERVMADNTVLTTVRRAVVNKEGKQEVVAHEIQARDTALALALTLSGQKPEDYGFTDFYRTSGVNAGSFSYSRFYLPEDGRKAAFEKWKEWRAKNP
jgi:hypothetical protein